MTENVMVKSRRKAGDFLIGIGIVVAGLAAGLYVAFGAAAGGLVLAGMLLVVIGYLKRIAVALESR